MLMGGLLSSLLTRMVFFSGRDYRFTTASCPKYGAVSNRYRGLSEGGQKGPDLSVLGSPLIVFQKGDSGP